MYFVLLLIILTFSREKVPCTSRKCYNLLCGHRSVSSMHHFYFRVVVVLTNHVQMIYFAIGPLEGERCPL